jgi:hypothetical protein
MNILIRLSIRFMALQHDAESEWYEGVQGYLAP